MAKSKEKPLMMPETKKALELYDWYDERFQKIDFSELNQAEANKELELLDVLEKNVGINFGMETRDRNNPIDCWKIVKPGGKEPSAGERDVSQVRQCVREYVEYMNKF